MKVGTRVPGGAVIDDSDLAALPDGQRGERGRPLICLVAIVRDEVDVIPRCLASVRPLIGNYCIVDTGSTDGTQQVARAMLEEIPGELHERPWRSFGENLTEALELARGNADWLLRLDADMSVEAHPDLRGWLADDPDPDTDAWNVEIVQAGMRHRLPLLMRGNLEWRYVGKTHEYLDPMGRKHRSLLGLTVEHHADGCSRDAKYERDLELLRDEFEAADPRAVFYTAETLRFMGRTDEAIQAYEQRASLNGWDEERWYARYQAAQLAGDVGALIDAWRARPHRHEPLAAAARIVAQTPHNDLLFLEAV